MDVYRLFYKWNREFRNLKPIKLDYHPFLGFGYVVEDRGLEFFITKTKLGKETLLELHSLKDPQTVQTVQVPPEALHLGLRLIDKIEKPLVKQSVATLGE